jgi:hypothetical protein
MRHLGMDDTLFSREFNPKPVLKLFLLNLFLYYWLISLFICGQCYYSSCLIHLIYLLYIIVFLGDTVVLRVKLNVIEFGFF